MILGGALVGVGLALAAWGVRTATNARRPADLAGALAAPIGLAIAAVGAAAIVRPGFLG